MLASATDTDSDTASEVTVSLLLLFSTSLLALVRPTMLSTMPVMPTDLLFMTLTTPTEPLPLLTMPIPMMLTMPMEALSMMLTMTSNPLFTMRLMNTAQLPTMPTMPMDQLLMMQPMPTDPLSTMLTKILEQLSQLEHAPNAQMMTSQPGARRAPETFAGDSDDDDVWDPDTKSIRGKRCHLAEHFDDTDEGDTMDTERLGLNDFLDCGCFGCCSCA